MRISARPIVIAFAVLLLLTSAHAAYANDSDAPPGATERWLPCENWVMYHWLPFREDLLFKLTGITRYELKQHLYKSDTNTLSELIVKRGKDPDVIAAKLMSRWKGKVSDRQFTELTRRTNALMTQSHLSQHVFFHLFHDPAIGLKARWIFNVSVGDYHRARMTGWAPREIAKHGGVTVYARRYAARWWSYAVSRSEASGATRPRAPRRESSCIARRRGPTSGSTRTSTSTRSASSPTATWT